jgi:tetratricopeptide (TPR) repeat protein
MPRSTIAFDTVRRGGERSYNAALIPRELCAKSVKIELLFLAEQEGFMKVPVGHYPALFSSKKLTVYSFGTPWFRTMTFRTFICGAALIVWVSAAPGQYHPQTPGGEERAMGGWVYLDFKINGQPQAARSEWLKTGRDSACFFPPLNTVQDLTVGAAELATPSNAKKEYGKACESLAGGKIDDAEKHLRKATELYPKYSASWVLIGQILEQRADLPGSRDACQKAAVENPGYVQAYLCLADIAMHQGDWSDVLAQSSKAIDLDPANDAAGYVYKGCANYSLHQLPEAEASALKAASIENTRNYKDQDDRDKHSDPRVHVLLAQIYDEKGETAKETAELREFLKTVRNPQAKAMVEQSLKELEQQSNK